MRGTVLQTVSLSVCSTVYDKCLQRHYGVEFVIKYEVKMEEEHFGVKILNILLCKQEKKHISICLSSCSR